MLTSYQDLELHDFGQAHLKSDSDLEGGILLQSRRMVQTLSRVKKFMHFDCWSSSLIFFIFQFRFLYLGLHVFASGLDKDSSELKVLAVINSKVEQTVDCS